MRNASAGQQVIIIGRDRPLMAIASRTARIRPSAAVAIAVAASASLFVGTTPAQAASHAVPTYEVKINLTTTALDASHTPLAAVKSAFGITGSAKARSYTYYDTGAQALDAQDWEAPPIDVTGRIGLGVRPPRDRPVA